MTDVRALQSGVGPDPRGAAREALGGRDIQTGLPRDTTDWGDWSAWNFHLGGDAFQIVLWLLGLTGIAVILWSLRDRFWNLGRHASEPDAAGGELAVARILETTRLEAEELARRGLFGEAMHALLLTGLAETRKRLRDGFADSLTSREVVARVPLPRAGRDALARIVEAVERSYFGACDAGAGDYESCRDSFDALKAALVEELRT
jgi:hypothetical protein